MKHAFIRLCFCLQLLFVSMLGTAIADPTEIEIKQLLVNLRSRNGPTCENAIELAFSKYGQLKKQPMAIKEELLKILSKPEHLNFHLVVKNLRADDLSDLGIKTIVRDLVLKMNNQERLKHSLINLLPRNICQQDPVLRQHFIELLKPEHKELRSLALSKLHKSDWYPDPKLQAQVIDSVFMDFDERRTPDDALMKEFFSQLNGTDWHKHAKLKAIGLQLLDKALDAPDANKYPVQELLVAFNSYDWYQDQAARAKIMPHLFKFETLEHHNQMARHILKHLTKIPWHEDKKIREVVLGQLRTGDNLDIVLEMLEQYDWINDAEIKKLVLNLLSHSNQLKRHSIIDFLNRQNWHKHPELRPVCIEKIKVLEHPEYLKLLNQLTDLNQDPEIKTVFIQALKSDHPKTKEFALEHLVNLDWFNDQDIAPIIFDMLGTRDMNDKFNYIVNKLIIKALKGKPWDKIPTLKPKLVMLMNHEFDHEIFDLFKGVDWHRDPEIRARILAILHADNKNSNMVHLFQFLQDYNWVHDLEIKNELIRYLRQGQYIVPLMQMMLNPRALGNAEIMVEFSNIYLQLPRERRLQLLSHNLNVFSKIYHPQTELLILQDMGSLANTHYQSVDFENALGLLEHKIDHPEAQSVLEKYMRITTLTEPQKAKRIARLLIKHPQASKLAARHYLEILSYQNPGHALFNDAIEHLKQPAMVEQLGLEKYIDFVTELKKTKGLSRSQDKHINLVIDNMHEQRRHLKHMDQQLFSHLARAIENNDLNKVQQAMDQYYYYERYKSVAKQNFKTIDDVIDFLYKRYDQEPLLQKKVALLEARHLSNQLPFDKKEMSFVEFIETLEDPRSYVEQVKQRYLKVDKNSVAPIDQMIELQRHQGKITANDPLGHFTRAIETRASKVNPSFIQCIMQSLVRK